MLPRLVGWVVGCALRLGVPGWLQGKTQMAQMAGQVGQLYFVGFSMLQPGDLFRL